MNFLPTIGTDDEEKKKVLDNAARIAALPKVEAPDPMAMSAMAADSGRNPMSEQLPSGETVDAAVSRTSSLPAIQPDNREDLPALDTTVYKANTTGLPEIPYSVSDDLAAKQKELANARTYKDKKWSKWDKVAAAVDGWAKGGIFNAISAVRNPHYFEDQRIRRDEARLLPEIETLSQMQALDYKNRNLAANTNKTMLDNQGKAIENAYKIVTDSPRWKSAMEAKEITQQDADYFKSISGLDLPPRQWQAIKEEWVNGKLFSRPEYSNQYGRNTSVPIKPDEVPRNIDFGGGPMPLTPKLAAAIIASQVNSDAQRLQGANTTNVKNAIEVAKANNAAITKWYSDNLNLRLEGAKAIGGGIASSGKLAGIANQMQTLAGQMQITQDRLDAAISPKDQAAIQKELDAQIKQFGGLQSDFDAEMGKFNGGQQMVTQIQSASIPMPKSVTAPKVDAVQVMPKTSKGGKNNNVTTEDAYTRSMKKIRGY